MGLYHAMCIYTYTIKPNFYADEYITHKSIDSIDIHQYTYYVKMLYIYIL